MPTHDVTKSRVIFSGRFNYDGFYNFLFNLFAANNYVVLDESHAQKDKGGFDKVEVEWKFQKLIDDYTKFVVELKMVIQHLRDVIVKKDDAEQKMQQGDVDLTVHGEIVTDRQGLWDKNKILEALRNFYERYLFRQTLYNYWVEVYKDVFLFENEIKSFFTLPQWP